MFFFKKLKNLFYQGPKNGELTAGFTHFNKYHDNDGLILK